MCMLQGIILGVWAHKYSCISPGRLKRWKNPYLVLAPPSTIGTVYSEEASAVHLSARALMPDILTSLAGSRLPRLRGEFPMFRPPRR